MNDLDPWEYELISDLDDLELVAWTDEEALSRYPEYKWLYDKYELSNRLDSLRSWDLEKEEPDEYPVIIKPKINLLGMGMGARKIDRAKQLPSDRTGLMAQKFAKGLHFSTDYIVRDKKVIDSRTFLCKKNDLVFWCFESVGYFNKSIIDFIESLRFDHGVINVESIDKYIIEVHLRPSVQFADIDGGLVRQIPRFMKTGEWDKTRYVTSYSRVYRQPDNAIVSLTAPLPWKPLTVKSVQKTWLENKPLGACVQDEFSFRYLVINGTDIADIEAYAKQVHKIMKFEPVKS